MFTVLATAANWCEQLVWNYFYWLFARPLLHKAVRNLYPNSVQAVWAILLLTRILGRAITPAGLCQQPVPTWRTPPATAPTMVNTPLPASWWVSKHSVHICHLWGRTELMNRLPLPLSALWSPGDSWAWFNCSTAAKPIPAHWLGLGKLISKILKS